MKESMANRRFGIEIEMTGITRTRAAEIIAEYFGTRAEYAGGYYRKNTAKDSKGRTWTVMYDGSISCKMRINGTYIPAGEEYSVELVSPILTYAEDMKDLQEIIRRLRKAGATTNSSCGIHVHLDGADHTARSIRNFVNIIAARGDLLYKALQIEPARAHFCRQLSEDLVQRMKNATTMDKIRRAWYAGYRHEDQSYHYHGSRYHLLNLHSFFNGNHTVEIRGYNSTLHAGKVRAYIVLALGMNEQALTQKSASAKKPQTENEKFSMRTWLNRMGLIGDEFAACREHLCKHLNGCAAWRFGRAA